MQVQAQLPVPPAGPRSADLSDHFFPPLLMQPLGWGGRLKLFSPFWRDVLGCTHYAHYTHYARRPWRDSTLTSPPLHLLPCRVRTSALPQGKNNFYIDQEVEILLLKEAIEEVPLFPPLLSYISNIFLVPKKSNGMRSILNLKKLNAAHLNTPYFRMETVEDVCHTLRPGD
jgi:hypothetical protein